MNRVAITVGALALLAPALAAADPGPSRLYVRLGVAYVHPMVQSNEMELADIDGPASLSLQNGPIAGSGTDISSATIPAAIIGYVLPWANNRLSIETVLGPPLDVKFSATGSLRDKPIAPTALGIPTGVMALGPEMGEAKAAPPVVTLVYSLIPTGTIRPYVGAGVAVMLTYDAHATNPVLTEVTKPDMSVAPAPGIALQTGLEARITSKVYARLDVKFIGLMLARAEVHNIVVKTPDIPLFEQVEVGTAKMSAWVNPLIIQGGVGMDF